MQLDGTMSNSNTSVNQMPIKNSFSNYSVPFTFISNAQQIIINNNYHINKYKQTGIQ